MNRRAFITKPVTLFLVTLACMLGLKQVVARGQEFDVEEYDLFFLKKSNMKIKNRKRFMALRKGKETRRNIMLLDAINTDNEYAVFSQRTKIKVNSIKNLIQATIRSDDAKRKDYQIIVIQGIPAANKDKEAEKESELSISLMRMHQKLDLYSLNGEPAYYFQYNLEEEHEERNSWTVGISKRIVSKSVPMVIIAMAKVPKGIFSKDFVRNLPNKQTAGHDPDKTYRYTEQQSDELRAIFSASQLCYYVTKEQNREKKQAKKKDFKLSKAPWEGNRMAFEFRSIAKDVNAKTLGHPQKTEEYKYIVDIKNDKKQGLVWTQKLFSGDKTHSNQQNLAYIQDNKGRNGIDQALVQIEDSIDEELIFKKATDPRDFDLFSIETPKIMNLTIKLKESNEVLKKYPALRLILWSILAETVGEPIKDKQKAHVRHQTMYAGLRASPLFQQMEGGNKVNLSDVVEEELQSEPIGPNAKEVKLIKYRHFVHGINTSDSRTDYIHSISVSISVPGEKNTQVFKFFAAHKALLKYLVWHKTATNIELKGPSTQRSWKQYDEKESRYISATVLEATIRNAKKNKNKFKYTVHIPGQKNVHELDIEMLDHRTKIQDTVDKKEYDVKIRTLNDDAFNDASLYDNKNKVETSDEETSDEETSDEETSDEETSDEEIYNKDMAMQSKLEIIKEEEENETETEPEPETEPNIEVKVSKQGVKNASNNRPWNTNSAFIVAPLAFLVVGGIGYAASGKNQRKSEDNKGRK